MKIIIPLSLLTLFIWLAKTSMAEGYDIAEVERLNNMAVSHPHPIADIWGLSDADIARPVDLFGEGAIP